MPADISSSTDMFAMQVSSASGVAVSVHASELKHDDGVVPLTSEATVKFS